MSVCTGVDEEFMPWLVAEVSAEVESIITSRDVITEIVREVVETRGTLYAAGGARDLEYEPPPDSITPPSLSEEEHEGDEREYLYTCLPTRPGVRATAGLHHAALAVRGGARGR
ncbi:putative Flagellar Radial spoke protein [Operophtera brumata]|uniref:Putative Flagellar Radial spoke protein n=1 Tax=Operophtera brumata TaxID=104452 RepID=A0A0L7KW72_OPEBR|nr:putative Flagellar Radial spoke protein [Operophtera brumata]